ncbi:hypothetical protein LWE61_06610 [Sphingobium sufflavum]|uniref:hypothetical protein n=1 Tax=Sphingobium sufflavum TaxID=1129547 RepID=UPI001F1CC14E|nr:hypothetical protein [Sphingobium sufflavum]MCE7796231.1 hypothetical protein [Sphingobium sufflavum]
MIPSSTIGEGDPARSRRHARRAAALLAAGFLTIAAPHAVMAKVGPKVSGTKVSATKAPAAAKAATPAPLPAPPADGIMGFVMTSFSPAVHIGKDDCPEGPQGVLRDHYLETLPAPEATRLRLKVNEEELTSRWKKYAVGPDDTNICSQPQLFDRPPTRFLKGKVAQGINLDGDSGNGAGVPNGCAHENFFGPDGEPGVDNQYWRVQGCAEGVRGVNDAPGETTRGLNQFLLSGEHSQVLILRGVDSLVRDDDVEIIYANTEDRAIVDSNQKFLPGASYSVTRTPQYRNVLRGRIVNGVLTTQPVDIRLRQTWGQGGGRDIRGARSEWALRRSQLRLTFQPDGSLHGIVAGYQPLLNVIQSPSIGGIGAATAAGINCAGIYKALKLAADGDRDAGGQCTTISTAIEASAIPAFINDRPAGQKVAER